MVYLKGKGLASAAIYDYYLKYHNSNHRAVHQPNYSRHRNLLSHQSNASQLRPHRCREIGFVLKNKFIADSTFALSFWTINCQWYQRITNILNHHSRNFSVVQINLVNKLFFFTDINTQSTRTWKQETPITKLFLCLKV